MLEQTVDDFLCVPYRSLHCYASPFDFDSCGVGLADCCLSVFLQSVVAQLGLAVGGVSDSVPPIGLAPRRIKRSSSALSSRRATGRKFLRPRARSANGCRLYPPPTLCGARPLGNQSSQVARSQRKCAQCSGWQACRGCGSRSGNHVLVALMRGLNRRLRAGARSD